MTVSNTQTININPHPKCLLNINLKKTIINNDPIEEKLNVITVISNICRYKRRWDLIRDFINRMEYENNVNLYVVELAYEHQNFVITDSNNKNHLQLKTNTPALWHKENLINIGVKKLLPPNWKAFAWIDSDIEFDSVHWAMDTLKLLNGYYDIVQLFTCCFDQNYDGSTMSVFQSFGYKYVEGGSYISSGINYWHPGYAWACTRKTYEQMGGLIEKAILGSGDWHMAASLIGLPLAKIYSGYHENYKKLLEDYRNKVKNLRFGYVPTVIVHHFHGCKKDRKYLERSQILKEFNYDPEKHITYDNNGLMIPSKLMCNKFIQDIYHYFAERNEDYFYEKN